MATSLGSLFIDLTADTGKFESDMGRAARIADRRAKDIEKAITGGIDGSIKKLGELALAYVALDQTVGRFFRSLEKADALSKASQKIGISVKALSGLDYAADLSDVNFDSLNSGLEKFNKNIIAAQQSTGEQRQAFKALGIGVEDLKRLNPEQLLLKVADGFEGARDGAAKTAVSMALFGKSGADLIPLLNGGARSIRELSDEAQRLGITIDDDTAKAAEAFNDNITRMKAAADGFFMKLASHYAPQLEHLTSVIADPEFQRSVENWVDKTVELADRLVKAAPTILKVVLGIRGAMTGAALGRVLGPWGAAGGALVGGVLGYEATDIADMALPDIDPFVSREKAYADLNIQIQTLAGSYSLLWKRIQSGESGAQGTLAEDAKNADLMLKRIAALNNQLRAANGIANGAANDQKPLRDLNIEVDNSAEKLAEFKRQLALYDAELMKTDADAVEVMKKQQDAAQKIIEQFRTPDETLAAQVKQLDELYGAGFIDAETRTRALAAANDDYYKGLAKLDPEADDTFSAISIYAEQAARNMQDTFAEFLFDPFKDGLAGLARNFTDTLQRMVAQAAAAQIFNALAGGLSGSSNPAMNALGSFISGKRANGGSVNAGSLYLVGERGPELFAPSMAGTVIPNGRMPVTDGAGGGSDVVINNYGDQQVSARKSMQANGRELVEIVVNAVNQDLSSNGAMSKSLQQTFGLRRAAQGR